MCLKSALRPIGGRGRRTALSVNCFPMAVLAFPKPVIAAINGPAVGVGATMPLSFDIRLASTKAKFMFPFPRLGVTPEYGSSYFLPRVIGFGKAAELIYTAKMIDAEEALSIGMVNSVLPPEELPARGGKDGPADCRHAAIRHRGSQTACWLQAGNRRRSR